MTTPRVRQYVRDAADAYGVHASEVWGRSRKVPVARARRAVVRRLRDDGFSQSQIGRWLHRHPSTVWAMDHRQ